jgi:hypothetical protein
VVSGAAVSRAGQTAEGLPETLRANHGLPEEAG